MTPIMQITDHTADIIENKSIFGIFRNTPFPSFCSCCFCSVLFDFISFLSSFLLFFMVSSVLFHYITLRSVLFSIFLVVLDVIIK